VNDFYTHVNDPWEASVEAARYLPLRKRKFVIYAPPLTPFLLLATMGTLLLMSIVL
jgi:hypothetical protein